MLAAEGNLEAKATFTLSGLLCCFMLAGLGLLLPSHRADRVLVIMLMIPATLWDVALGPVQDTVAGHSVGEMREIIAFIYGLDSHILFHHIIEEVLWEAALLETFSACEARSVEPHVTQQPAQWIPLRGRLVSYRYCFFPWMNVCDYEKMFDFVQDVVGSAYVSQLVGKKAHIYQCLVMNVRQLDFSQCVSRGAFGTVAISGDSKHSSVHEKAIANFNSFSARLSCSEADAGGRMIAVVGNSEFLDFAEALKLGSQLLVGNLFAKIFNDDIAYSTDTVEHFSLDCFAASSEYVRSGINAVEVILKDVRVLIAQIDWLRGIACKPL